MEFGDSGDERLVVLNSVAKSIVGKQRGISKEWGVPYNGTEIHRMNDSVWKKARVRAAKLWQEENLRPAHLGYLSIRNRLARAGTDNSEEEACVKIREVTQKSRT